MTSTKRIESMTTMEMRKYPKKWKESKIQESAVLAIRDSILHGNSTSANNLLKELPRLVPRKPNAKKTLIDYFLKWGSFYFDSSRGILKYSRSPNATAWTKEYEAEVNADPWDTLIRTGEAPNSLVHDANKEFRRVINRLSKILEDPERRETVLHAKLVAKVEELLFSYGRAEDFDLEDKRGSTLFDESAKRRTMRASKYAIGS